MKTRKHSYYREVLYFLLALIVAVAIGSEVMSQENTVSDFNQSQLSSPHNFAIGLRAGGQSGLTFKMYLADATAVEFIAWGSNRSLGLTALYEFYAPAFDAPGLNWYYGAGVHGRYRSDNVAWGDARIAGEQYALGVDGIVGLEYKIPPIPIAVSADLKPNIEAWSTGRFGYNLDPSIGVKVIF